MLSARAEVMRGFQIMLLCSALEVMKAACNYRDNQNCQGLFYGWFCLLSASLTASQAAGPPLPLAGPQTSKDHSSCICLRIKCK